ncbi:hypothetical protein BKA70DRAFT_140289 [Coprinopsis sp. MPI-PUGE-AT-0042]|nr:hypothetical protein BKA70DRAFT_140289 [Coprinopsis sp. MPI-PUGE-AT-0042]
MPISSRCYSTCSKRFLSDHQHLQATFLRGFPVSSMPKAGVITKGAGFGIMSEEDDFAMQVDGTEDMKMKVEEDVELKGEEGSSNQRVSSRLKKKETLDWSFLRGKKRNADAVDSDVKREESEAKKPKTSIKKEKVELKEEATLVSLVKVEGDQKPRSRKQTAIRVKREPKREQLPTVKDELVKEGIIEHLAETSDFSRRNEEQNSNLTIEVVDESQTKTGGKSKSGRPKRSSRKAPRPKSVKKESSCDPQLPAAVKKEESVEPKAEVKVEIKKGKKEALPALELDLTARFKAAGISQLPFAIPNYTEAVHGVKVPRAFTSKTYGGAIQRTCPKIKAEKLALHGFDNFMFLNDDLHPLAPQVPGAPGIFINIAGGRRDKLMRVFVRMKGAVSPPIWWYMGQYELRNSQALTKEEWGMQTEQVKRAWAEGIVRYGWGNGKQAGIHGRKVLGRTPTSEEIKGYLKSKAFEKTVTATDVLRALRRGDERLNIFTMKCVAYDVAFQRDVAQKYPEWLMAHPAGH